MDSFFIFLNKPEGLTSQQCLSRFKRRFGYKKVGHHGTLDPFASGLLLVGVGEATKYFSYLDDSRKTYEAVLQLGSATDTLDCTGKVVASSPVPNLHLEAMDHVLARFVGAQRQCPPMYSAVKIGGERLYHLARQGLSVERRERDITIFELCRLDWQNPDLSFRAVVSRGTYVRVLGEDIAKALETVGHLKKLVRTELGNIGMDRAFHFDMELSSPIPEERKMPIESLLENYPSIELTESQTRDLICGKRPLCEAPQVREAGRYRAYSQARFLGLVDLNDGALQVERFLNTSDLTAA